MDGSFDAVVQPLDFHLDGQKGVLGWWQYRRLCQASDDLRAGLERRLVDQGAPLSRGGSTATPGCFAEFGITSPATQAALLQIRAGRSSRRRHCAAHMVVERRHFLLPLMEYAAGIDHTTLDEFYRGVSESRYQHLLDHDINSGAFLPLEFDKPFYYRSSRVPTDVSVGSSVRLGRELDSLNRRLGIDLKRRMPAMQEFVRASRDELVQHEGDEKFWVRFAFLVLRKLVDCSLEHRFPILLR